MTSTFLEWDEEQGVLVGFTEHLAGGVVTDKGEVSAPLVTSQKTEFQWAK